MSAELLSSATGAVSGTAGRARIRERSFAYALRAIKLYEFLQSRRNGVGWVLGRQYLRSASSIGANVEEAQSAESRADFIHKLGIAQKEARESLYWLRLLTESGILSGSRVAPLLRETDEIIAIITAIVISAKAKVPGNHKRNSSLRTHNSELTQ